MILMISNLSNQLSINQLYIMYNDIRYIKLSGPEKEQKKIFNIQSESDILMVVSEEEYDTLESLYDESGKNSFLPPWVVSQSGDNLIYENFPTHEHRWGLYVKENVLSNFNKNYPFVIWKNKEIYIPIKFLKMNNISFIDSNIEESFYLNINDHSKLQLISDEDFSSFQKIFKSGYSDRPRYIKPFSDCIYSNHMIDDEYKKYIKLSCLTKTEIELLNNI